MLRTRWVIIRTNDSRIFKYLSVYCLPNFSRLRSWMSSWSRYSPYGHFRLVRDSEFEVARSIHQADEKINDEITNYESKKVKERVLALQGWKLEPDFGVSDSYGVL